MQKYRFKEIVATYWQTHRLRFASVGLTTLALTGCGRPEPSTDAAPAATTGEMSGTQHLAEGSSSLTAESLPPPTASPELSPPVGVDDTADQPPSSENAPPPRIPAIDGASQRPQLRPDWGPGELNAFLGDIDREMGALINGQAGNTDPRAVQEEVVRLVALKRVAAERLSEHPDGTERDRVTGRRGVLQALSHLASMGDLKAAEELQAIAEDSRNSPDTALRSDSQLVLIGLGIESLRHGKSDAAAHVMDLAHELLEGDQRVDVATLMVLGQAKDTLLQYEYQAEAEEIRDLITDRFGDAQDAEVARMAAMIASSGFSQANSALEHLDQLRQQIVATATTASSNTPDEHHSTMPVEVSAWQAAIKDVLSTPADLLTVEFLCGASLEAEAVGRNDIAAATYDVLQRQFADRQDAIGRVARTALRARENRQAVIGREFDPDLPTVSGQPVKMADYRGKIVLMPFWSSAFPNSLAVLPNLQEIQAKYPDRVSIVGMNLDVAGTDVEGFMQRDGLSFPSFRSESDPSAEIVNEVAYRFGAVTLLFVAIMDAEGKVVHLNFSGEDLMPEVQKRIR
ncbi:TlpA family protein disulfide reductase [Allorhodopirellula heiligendammensis]|uniref:Thiol-disulfide oxidoreductase n=1 Tax=Allorhodopirellula heiligendammensis TaxID=2714739 RepID=A0A5C6C1S9_9BACT|nr:TlpA family protein disulfide reductase [Allorhodopirellula heiligendammensis]TWU16779.1 thiol-disulfide oxidoreductase [Allorhodopirellula heiligendammensis]